MTESDHPRPGERLNEDNAEEVPCKLGTMSKMVWIHEDDFPLAQGDVIRYAEHEQKKCSIGRVRSDPDDRYLFIGRDSTAPTFAELEEEEEDDE